MGNYTLHYVINYKEKVFEKEYIRACVYMCICIYIYVIQVQLYTHTYLCVMGWLCYTLEMIL